MKRFALATAALIALTSAASAMNVAGELSSVDAHAVHQFVPTADLGSLTADQIVALELALNSGDDGNRGGAIRAILN